MNEVDASEHHQGITSTAGDTTSLCTVIIDTNPRAWAAMNDVLPLHKAVSSILVFLNANLAFNNSNQVAVIASHTNRAVWLYPTRPEPRPSSDHGSSEDVDMSDAPPASAMSNRSTSSANKYPQFAQIETAVLASIKKLLDETTEADLTCTTSQLSGALTLALAHINKTSLALAANSLSDKSNTNSGAAGGGAFASSTIAPGMSAHVLILSVSDTEPSQYIPTMNAVFAAAQAQIPIDVISLSPASVRDSASSAEPGSNGANHTASPSSSFLQQASHITNGIFLCPSTPRGLLSYLTFGLACADKTARNALVPPTHHTVDFRAACFCHGRVVDTGFVCSVCLSIFCSVPTPGSGDASNSAASPASATATAANPAGSVECLTCGTSLALGSYGARPAVVPRRRRKKRQRVLANGSVREESGSATATPAR